MAPNDDEYIRDARQQIATWESQGPGFLSQVGDFVVWPVQQPAEALIPEAVQQAVGRAIEMFLNGLSATSRVLVDVDEVRARVAQHREGRGHPLQGSDDAAKHYWNWHSAYAAAEGGATGATGLPGLAADIPALFTIAIRIIQQIDTCYGYDIHTDTEHEYVMQILRTGSTGDIKAKVEFLIGLKQVEQILLKVSWKKMSESLAQKELGRMAAMAAMRQFEKSIGIQLTKRKALQMIPAVGALVGASFKATFVDDVGRAAYMSYRRRWIEEHANSSGIES